MGNDSFIREREREARETAALLDDREKKRVIMIPWQLSWVHLYVVLCR